MRDRLKYFSVATVTIALTLTGATPRHARVLAQSPSTETPQLCDNLQPVRTFVGHLDWVNSIAISSDSQTLASASHGTVKIWNLRTGELLSSLDRFVPSLVKVESVSFGSDDRTLISVRRSWNYENDSYEVQVWDIETGELLETHTRLPDSMTHGANSTSVSSDRATRFVSPDGKILFTIKKGYRQGDSIDLSDAKSGKLICTLPRDKVRTVVASPDGQFLVAAVGQKLELMSLSKTCPSQPNQIRKEESERLNKIALEQLNRGYLEIAERMFWHILDINRELCDRVDQGDALYNLGETSLRLHQFDDRIGFDAQALQIYQLALPILKETNDLVRIGNTFNNMGILLDNKKEALKFYEQALAIRRELGDKIGERDTLINLGAAYLHLKQDFKAKGFFQQALIIAQSTNNPTHKRDTLVSIGAAYVKAERDDRAKNFFEQALEIHRMKNDKIGEANTLRAIGDTYHSNFYYGGFYSDSAPSAFTFYEQARTIYQDIGDKVSEADTLTAIAWEVPSSETLGILQQALDIYREIGNRENTAVILHSIGQFYLTQVTERRESNPEYLQVKSFFEEAATIYEKLADAASDNSYTLQLAYLNILSDLGDINYRLGEYSQALEAYNKALRIHESINNYSKEFNSIFGSREPSLLRKIGKAHQKLENHSKALEMYQKTLEFCRKFSYQNVIDECLALPRQGLSIDRFDYFLYDIGEVYFNLGEYDRALEFFDGGLSSAALTLSPSAVLNGIGRAYERLRNLSQALLFFKEASEVNCGGYGAGDSPDATLVEGLRNLALELEWYDFDFNRCRTAKGLAFGNKAELHRQLGEYEQALESYQEALKIFQERDDLSNQAVILNNIGVVHKSLGQYDKALESYQQALAIRQEIEDPAGEATNLNNIGEIYRNQGQYPTALEYYQQALTVFRNINNSRGEGATLHNFGAIYDELGQSDKALEFYQQALVIRRQIRDRAAEGTTLNNIGLVYERKGQAKQALSFYQQALIAHQEAENRSGEGTTLNNIGLIYDQLGQSEQGLEFLQQALTIFQDLGDSARVGNTLDSIGTIYASLERYDRAIESYQQALVLEREVGNPVLESTTLNNIAQLLQQQNQPQLAILFYKQSVNITETIRQDLQKLPTELQQSYTETVASTYRNLADLLLQQDRILEAQRVLDLLKVQELEDYLQDVRGNTNTTQGIPNTPPEQQIWTSYTDLVNQAIQIGQELAQLRQQSNRTPQQEQRLVQLVAAQAEIVRQFNTFIDSPEVQANLDKLSRTAQRQNVDLEELNALQDNLRNLNQNAVLFYPLILEDRLELILVTPNSPPIRRTVPVTREQLNAAVLEMRRALQNPTLNAQRRAQPLYNWLIKPIEADLQAANAETIIYAPDGVLRYIPLAALYDGNQWLVQRFRVNNITAASLTDLNAKPQTQPRILAGAFANVSYPVKVGEEEFFFRALPFAGTEVENLAEIVSQTTQLFDTAFSRDETLPKMDDYSIVHFATHGAFVVGSPEDSFIIFGDGKIATLSEIKNWSLKNVDLVVLSACETGVGGKFDNGEEILGLGYQFQRAGARATIASLWSVDDGGTQALMNGFYGALQQSEMTKAEALRQAQIALITGDYSAVGGERGIVAVRAVEGLEPQVQERLSHPYYWAPFILIGNGL